MTHPLAICFVAVAFLVAFCFWAWLKDNEARRQAVLSAAVEQLAGKVDALTTLSEALAKKAVESEGLSTRLGMLELRVTGSTDGGPMDPLEQAALNLRQVMG